MAVVTSCRKVLYIAVNIVRRSKKQTIEEKILGLAIGSGALTVLSILETQLQKQIRTGVMGNLIYPVS